jgi:hypothetical protein
MNAVSLVNNKFAKLKPKKERHLKERKQKNAKFKFFRAALAVGGGFYGCGMRGGYDNGRLLRQRSAR